jgi:hypothetical protein
MAKSNVDPHNFIALQWATNLSAKEFYLVKLTSERKIELASTGEAAFILYEPNGTEAEYNEGIRPYGTIVAGSERQKVILGGVVAVGNQLECNSEGKAIKASNGIIIGVALEGGVAGVVVEALTCVPVTVA